MDDLTNVEDAEEDVSTSGDLFSISSFGVDYPVETLISRMDKKLFYIPPFQRAFAWSQNQSSRFIESLLLGLPIPGIFLFKEACSGKHLVIDGQQRLKSLLYFAEGILNGKEFVLTGLETKFGGRTYKTLDEADLRMALGLMPAPVRREPAEAAGTSAIRRRAAKPCLEPETVWGW